MSIALEPLLRDFSRWGFDRRGLAETTRYLYRKAIVRADGFMRERNRRIWRASQEDLLDYLSTTSPHPGSRNVEISALKVFFLFLFAENYRRDDPAEAIARPRPQESIPKALTLEQAQEVTAKAVEFGPVVLCLVLLLELGGLRREEARTLKWENVGPGSEWAQFRGKGGRERKVPLHPLVIEALKGCRSDPVWVFPSPIIPNQPVSQSWVAHKIAQLGEACGIHLTPHVFRHTFATRLLQLSDLPTTMRALGHRNMNTTAIYLKTWDPKMEADVGKLDLAGGTV